MAPTSHIGEKWPPASASATAPSTTEHHIQASLPFQTKLPSLSLPAFAERIAPLVVSRIPLHVGSLWFLPAPALLHFSPAPRIQPSSAPMGLRPPARMEQLLRTIQKEGPGSLQTRCQGQDPTLTPSPLFHSRRGAGAINRGCILLLPRGSTAGRPDGQHSPVPLDSAAACFLAKFPLLGCKMKSQTARGRPPAFHQDVPVFPGRSELV